MKPSKTKELIALIFLPLSFATLLGCGGGGNQDKATIAAPNSLQALYGRLTLNYRFNAASILFTDSIDLSAANLSADGKYLFSSVIGNTNRNLGCTINANIRLNYVYFCAIIDKTFGSTELFAFNLNGQQVVDGSYEYCSSSISAATCESNLITIPDGIILGSSGIASSKQNIALSSNIDNLINSSKITLSSKYAKTITTTPLSHQYKDMIEIINGRVLVQQNTNANQ